MIMEQPSSDRWWVLFGVSLGLFLIVLDNTILYTALPSITRALNASPTEALWMINIYPLVMAGLLLGTGTLSDIFGHRHLFLSGLALFGLASLMAAYASTATMLILARALLAVAAAAMMPATLALIRVSFHEEKERNMAIALWGMVAVIGAALGPLVSGALLSTFWWGSIFLINVPVVVLAGVVAYRYTPYTTIHANKSWDALSSAQALVVLAGIVFTVKSFTNSDLAVASFSMCLALLAAWRFVKRQKTLNNPLIDFKIFRNLAFSAGTVGAFFAMFAIAGLQLILSQRFQLVADFSPLQSGLLVTLLAIGTVPSSLLGGAYQHQIGIRPFIVGGLATSAIGSALLASTVHQPFGFLIFGLFITGIGIGAVMAVASATIMTNAPTDRAGMAGAIDEVSYELGSLFAVALVGSVLISVFQANFALPYDTPTLASNSLFDALSVANTLGIEGYTLRESAFSAFDKGFQWSLAFISLMLTVGTIICELLLQASKHARSR